MLEQVVLQPLSPELFWVLCLAFVIAFLLAFSVGANDVSNSFGTSVGSKVLTVTQACILATICEMAGATLLGYSVCDTFRKKMYDVQLYDGAQKELMLGALACLIGSSLWNIVATAFKMPISGTHSIVGATIGFSCVLRGWESIRWRDMIRVVASWFASPLLSGFISSLIYIAISKTIISKVDPLRNGLKALPMFYGATIFINVASIVIDGPDVLGLNYLQWYEGLFIATICAGATICAVALILVPKLKKEILGELLTEVGSSSSGLNGGAGGVISLKSIKSPAAYDNASFKPDEITSPNKLAGQRKDSGSPAVIIKQKRELSLDPQLLNEGSDGRPKPAVALKPAHLRRQMAQDQQQSSQMDEIDLGKGNPDLESGEAGGNSGEAPAASPAGRNSSASSSSGNPVAVVKQSAKPSYTDSGERVEVARLFASLQILTACFASFAHGTNDVSNAVAPLIPIWNIYTTGTEDVSVQTQVWILAFGSIGICTGLWAWGRAVMATISEGLTKITPSKGFSVELGAAISVLVATKMGLPISTTHCKVGSLVIVGFVSSKFLAQDNLFNKRQQLQKRQQRRQQEAAAAAAAADGKQELHIVSEGDEDEDNDAVDWKLFGNIAITWVSTVPAAAAASAITMYAIKGILL